MVLLNEMHMEKSDDQRIGSADRLYYEKYYHKENFMQQPENIRVFWDKFLKDTGRDPDTRYIDCFHFDNSEKWATALLQLVLEGKKKATASSRYYYEKKGMELPAIGNLSIVTDWQGNPHCVIETTKVTHLAFRDMTYDICKREGEDDSLESWQRGHINFFTEDGKAEGYVFTWDMPVVFEDFQVVYQPEI